MAAPHTCIMVIGVLVAENFILVTGKFPKFAYMLMILVAIRNAWICRRMVLGLVHIFWWDFLWHCGKGVWYFRQSVFCGS